MFPEARGFIIMLSMTCKGGEKMTDYELMMELTHNGDCDRCMYGLMGECHLQCTHIDEPDKEIEE